MEPTNHVHAHGRRKKKSCNKDKCMAAAAATRTQKEKDMLQKGIYSLANNIIIISTLVSLPSQIVAKSHHYCLKRKNTEVNHLLQMLYT